MQPCTNTTTRTAAACLRSADVRRVFAGACAWTLIGSLTACNVIGPAGIRSGRGAYSSAINATNDQQTLRSIVKIRYGETWSMLAVSSVTANMKFASRAGFDIGVGPDQNYAGNLVPLSGSVVFEENPTISYTPLDGGEFVRELLSPVPLRLYLLLIESGEIELTLRMLTASVNEEVLRGFAQTSTYDELPAFVRTQREYASRIGFGMPTRTESQRERLRQVLKEIQAIETPRIPAGAQ